jgi:hypothetical protein
MDTPILSIDEILSTAEVIRSREESDRTVLQQLTNVDTLDLKNRLLIWGSLGCPTAHTLYTLQLNYLDRCSDGVSRTVLEYISYLNPTFSIVDTLAALEMRLPGMNLSYSYTTTYALCIHVSKK